MDEAVQNTIGLSDAEKMRDWFKELPVIYRTRENVFRYYRQQNMLAISKADFIDKRTGNVRMGKTVLIRISDLIEEPEVLSALCNIFNNARLTARGES